MFTTSDRNELMSAVHQFKEANAKVYELEQKQGYAFQDVKELRDRLNTRIDDIETRVNRKTAGIFENKEDARGEEVELFHKFLRVGEKGLNDSEVKALFSTSDPQGGYLVPPEWADEIGRKYIQYSPIRPLARVVTISSNVYKAPYEGDTDFASGWVAETAARPATTTGTIRMEEIPVNELYARADISQTLLDDAGYDVEGWMQERIGTSFMVTEGNAFVVGDGVGKPEGLLNNPAVSSIPSNDASTITADSLIDMYYGIADYYAPTSTWLMKRSTMQVIRQLKDSYGQYLWQPGLGTVAPPTIMGQPYVEVIDMPDIAPLASPIIFGDIRRAYTIVDNRAMTMIRDPYTNKPFVEYYFSRYVGGQVVLPEAIRKMEITI